MVAGQVAHVRPVVCPSCGLRASGYMQPGPDGTVSIRCPRCGAVITQQFQPHQIQPQARQSHYPGLYDQPRTPPKLDLVDLLRLAYAPKRSLTRLYLSTGMKQSLMLVVVFSGLSAMVSVAATYYLGDIFGYASLRGAVDMLEQMCVSWVISILSFLVFAVVAALIARDLFGGRGDRTATVTLMGYCYPWFSLFSIMVLVVFSAGIDGLVPGGTDSWTNSDVATVLAIGALTFVAVILGLFWLLAMASRAVSVSSDIRLAGGALTVILAAMTTGVITLVASAVLELPIGISL